MAVTHISARSIHARLLAEQAALRADLRAQDDGIRLSAWEDSSVDAAIQRIAIGAYGTCGICGGEIPLERLDVLPTAVRCVRHFA